MAFRRFNFLMVSVAASCRFDVTKFPEALALLPCCSFTDMQKLGVELFRTVLKIGCGSSVALLYFLVSWLKIGIFWREGSEDRSRQRAYSLKTSSFKQNVNQEKGPRPKENILGGTCPSFYLSSQ